MPHFMDYFVVCGLHSEELERDSLSALSTHVPPLTRSYTPRVLSHFPDNVSWNPYDDAAVKTLCMPDGLLFKKNLKDPQKAFHSFLITRENATRAYGSVITFYEQVQDTKVLNTLEALQTSYRDARRHSLNSDHEHCFSRSEDTLFAAKCICFVTSKPIFRPCQAYLEQLYALTTGEHTAALPLESYLYNVLYEVLLPPLGKTVRLKGPLGRVMWRMPSQSELPLCDYSFREFFELLGVRNVMRLFSCVLLEHQILLKSADYEKLMLCAHCSIALLFPFSWPHVFVPILPASQRGFLDAPVPYIMGLRIDPSRNDAKYLTIPNESSLCAVDVDQGVVELPEELPGLPDMERLMLQVTEQVQEHGVNCPDCRDLPPSPRTTPSKHSIIEALRIVKELSDSGSDPKKLLTEISSLNNPHIPNLLNIATRAGIQTPISTAAEVDEGVFEDLKEGMDEEDSEKSEWDYAADDREEKFASAIREVFASYFVEHFANYENFIIMPRQSYDQWQRNREQFQNFDKTAFLSDQPSRYREFYSAFLETSMFSLFIDQKIVTFWEPEKTGHSLQLFDSNVEAYRDKSGLAKPPTTPGSRKESSSSDAAETPGEGEVIEEMAPLPHYLGGKQEESLGTTKTHTPGTFPQLDSSLLQMKGSEGSSRVSPELAGVRRSYSRPGSAVGGSRSGGLPGSPMLGRSLARRARVGGGSGVGGGFSSHSHAKFVNQLWRESRLRVKHMLGSSGESQNHIEENTHIAYLCDLLERIWGHGLKKRESKSPLWAHLMAYAEVVGREELSSPPSPTPAPGPLASASPQLTASMSSLSFLSTGGDESPRVSQNLRAQFRRRKFQSPQLRARVEAILQPPPSSFISDFRFVHSMRELKTDVGYARAWVRLSLEKKSLSRHLSLLLSNEELCKRRYREYAFLRTEEEREQFLYHLLTLTARDFSCFTTGFLHTTMTYRVLVVGEGKHFGLSTASLYVNLGGEYGETGFTEIPRGEYQIEITCGNLGPLICLRVGHDNSGLTPSLLVEMVLVHNIITGQTFRFNCGRWFARSEDDGSIERFLVAERVPQTMSKSCTMSALDVDSVLPSPGRRRRREAADKPVVTELKLSLRSAVDRIKTLANRKNKETSRLEILRLILGPGGFVKCMEQVFQFGFKSSRKFQKKLFIWDLLERVHEHLASVVTAGEGEEGRRGAGDNSVQSFLDIITRINSSNPCIGKDEKTMQFCCIGLRDHHLCSWVQLISQSPVSFGLCEPMSFLRDPELLQFLIDTVTLPQPLVIKLEPLLLAHGL